MSHLRLAAPIVLAAALGLAAAPAPAETERQSPTEQTPTPPRPGMEAPSPLQPGDAFGEVVMLPERTILYLQGHSRGRTRFPRWSNSFKSLDEYLAKESIKPDGPPDDDLYQDRR